MSKKIGICGLPNAGKSTLLKLLTATDIEINIYPFTTKRPNIALASVISENLLKLHQITKTKNLLPAYLEFVDIPGLIKGAHKGLGLGNEFLSYLRACDIILEVVRNFENEEVIHVEGEIDPGKDALIIEEEIISADKKIIEENTKKLEKQPQKREILENLKYLKENIEPFKRFPALDKKLKEYNLLLTKDWYLIINGEKDIDLKKFQALCFKKVYVMDFKFELEIEENEEIRKEFGSKKLEFLNQFRKDINLIEFYTFTLEITQSWLIEKNSTIIQAAQNIHTDFAKKFRSAEVISLEKFLEIKDWQIAKTKGEIKNVGRDYFLKEGDIIKINI